MKKKFILEILANEYVQRNEKQNENFKKYITNWSEYKETYIKTFLEDNQDFFKYEFDLNSDDEKIKKWSEIFFELVCFSFSNLVATSPDLYISLINEEDEGYACANFCTYVLKDNLSKFRKAINKIVNKQ